MSRNVLLSSDLLMVFSAGMRIKAPVGRLLAQAQADPAARWNTGVVARTLGPNDDPVMGVEVAWDADLKGLFGQVWVGVGLVREFPSMHTKIQRM